MFQRGRRIIVRQPIQVQFHLLHVRRLLTNQSSYQKGNFPEEKSGKRGKALSSMLDVLAHDPDSGQID